MSTLCKIIEYQKVKNEFKDVQENINDLSVIKLKLVKDSHFNSFDFSVAIFGQGDPDVVGPVLEFSFDSDDLLTEEELFQGIAKQKIPSLFCTQLLELLIKKNIRIEFNTGDESEEVVSLSNPGNGFLHAMIR